MQCRSKWYRKNVCNKHWRHWIIRIIVQFNVQLNFLSFQAITKCGKTKKKQTRKWEKERIAFAERKNYELWNTKLLTKLLASRVFLSLHKDAFSIGLGWFSKKLSHRKGVRKKNMCKAQRNFKPFQFKWEMSFVCSVLCRTHTIRSIATGGK